MMASRDLRVVMRGSAYNKQARAMLQEYRFSADMTQAEFADELSEELQAWIARATLSGYEIGHRGVPASVLLAAAAIAHRVIGVPGAQTLVRELRELLAKEES